MKTKSRSRLMRSFFLTVMAVFCVCGYAHAQSCELGVEDEASACGASGETRLTKITPESKEAAQKIILARQMLDIRPVDEQIESAIIQYLNRYRPQATDMEREMIASVLLGIINPITLEQVSVDAYAEIFTVEELKAMVEYHSSPEAQSISQKTPQLHRKIAPEIVRLLDKALMDFKLQQGAGQ